MPHALEMYWTAIPEVQVRMNVRASGRPDVGWHVHCLSMLSRQRRGKARMLFLGGDGWLERDLTGRGASRRRDRIDDPNAAEPAAATYDAIWCEMWLGRTQDLERLCERLALALRPDGYLFAYEYTGANRFAMSRLQREAIRAAFSLIPRRYRRRLGHTDEGPLDEPALPDTAGVHGEDMPIPIRSADIVPVLSKHFELVDCRPLGGTILQFALAEIAENFQNADRSCLQVLEMLFGIEDALIDTGELGSDFELIVARPRAAAAEQDRPATGP